MSGISARPPHLDPPNSRVLGAKGEATRQRLMDAAEVIFAEKGYFQASIGDVTSVAKVAQGTFYLYFPSKLEIFRTLVLELSHLLRKESELASQGARSRLEAERRGIQSFYRFVDRHRNLYKIVRQAEFVDPPLYRWYYERIAAGYTRRLTRAMEQGEIRSMDPEFAAWCLMAVADYTGQRYILWEERNQADVARLMDFVTAGLALHNQGGQ